MPLTAPLEHGAGSRRWRSAPTGDAPDGKPGWDCTLLGRLDGEVHGSPLPHQTGLTVAFSPDGHTVLTGGMEGKARFWDAVTGRPLGPPLEHGQWVTAVACSPSGRTAMTWRHLSRPGSGTPRLPDDLPRFATWVEVLTGLALDEHGDVQVLDRSGWLQRRDARNSAAAPDVRRRQRATGIYSPGPAEGRIRSKWILYDDRGT